MNALEATIGRVVGGLGILVCIVAVASRLLGFYFLAGVSTGALLQAGMAGVLIGCFLLLLAVVKTR